MASANCAGGMTCVYPRMQMLHKFATGFRLSAVALGLLIATGGYAQEPGREVIRRVSPDYPPILKTKGIGGLVRLVLVVNPSGTVKRTEVLGGNPILAKAAENALKQWNFSPSATETKEIVTLRFDPTGSHRAP